MSERLLDKINRGISSADSLFTILILAIIAIPILVIVGLKMLRRK